MAAKLDCVVVGAGLAGLACAKKLHQEGFSFRVVDAADDIGGRVRTDRVDGFLLDRGFQVLLTAYPETLRVLDYDKLKLCSFYPGALVRVNGRFRKIADPFRRPLDAALSLFSPIGTLSDKLKIAELRRQILSESVEKVFQNPESTSMQYLKNKGFSASVINRFFRPFFGGIFLESDLQTSSRVFEFVFRMFSSGDISLPLNGMGEIPKQLTTDLPPDSIRLNTRVNSLNETGVKLESGEKINAETTILAVEQPEEARLVGSQNPNPSCSVTCVYFSAPQPPISKPILVLNGENHGPVNNLAVLSEVSPSYAPDGQALVSATILSDAFSDDARLISETREQLTSWFGKQVRKWHTLRIYKIPYALPQQNSTRLLNKSVLKIRARLFCCGDYFESASIHSAMQTGRQAAECAINYLQGKE